MAKIYKNFKITAPYDLLDCPNSNILRIRNADNKQFEEDDVTIKIENDEITIRSFAKTKILVEVPVKAFLDIESNGALECELVHSDFIDLIAYGDILTNNLRSTAITLNSKHGNINCNGLTLAQNIIITTSKNGVCCLILSCVNTF